MRVICHASHCCTPLPAGPGAPKIWLCVTTVHLFDHIAGILCSWAHRGSPPFLSISQGYMFLSMIRKENAINYSWLRSHQICFLPRSSLPKIKFLESSCQYLVSTAKRCCASQKLFFMQRYFQQFVLST